MLVITRGSYPYPLVIKIAAENHNAINGKIHYKWSFSIASITRGCVLPTLTLVNLQAPTAVSSSVKHQSQHLGAGYKC